MNFREFAKENIVILDGGMGTMLESSGIKAGERPETWNISHPDVITGIHRAYFDAGSNVVNTNTFGANALKFSDSELREIIENAVLCAKRAKIESSSNKEKFIALDIGPLGRLLKPFGDLEFEEAYTAFAEIVKIGSSLGVDLITVETMNDSLETKAALLAVKDNTDLPVIVTNAYGSDSKLLSGATPECMVALLEGMGADYIGANCSFGPEMLFDTVKRLIDNSSLPIVFKPNAGLPEVIDGKTVYNVSAERFAEDVCKMVKYGVRIVGGCCGTTPEYIKALRDALIEIKPLDTVKKEKTVITSFSKAHIFDNDLSLIGESINPTGKKRMKLAVSEKDIDFIVNLAIKEEECGADALDVNVGVPGISEAEFLPELISALQYSTDLPLVIDTSDPIAMENALRIYNGKALINSVNGKRESMSAIFPLMKKYGGVAIALTLDENGISKTAEERLSIAKKILLEAEKWGISKKDLIFDPLAMTVSTDKESAKITLEAIRLIKNELGAHTSLGISNISFGLPKREAVNSSFLSMAAAAGLSAAIMNPASAEMMKSFFSIKALLGFDEDFKEYIAAAESIDVALGITPKLDTKSTCDNEITLKEAISKGLKDTAASITDKLLCDKPAMDIIAEEIIPALDDVGRGFESGTVYLPGLLLSAETAKCAFERIKLKVDRGASNGVKIVIATVKGDIHDIGKNIVKLLLENYGFEVIDLGKDVPPEKIANTALSEHCDIVALSALMTTTVISMEESIAIIREKAPFAKIIVGGAVLTKEYASTIGADAYAKDAMGAVRYAESILASKSV